MRALTTIEFWYTLPVLLRIAIALLRPHTIEMGREGGTPPFNPPAEALRPLHARFHRSGCPNAGMAGSE